MALEEAPFINSLNPTNPTNSDPIKQGDDHLRLIKLALKSTFPAIAGAVLPTHTELNFVKGVTSSIQTQLNNSLKATDTIALATAADKLSTARTISLAGDATGSAAFDGSANVAITVVVADNSHVHTTGNITGLDGVLSGKSSTGTTMVAGNGLSGGGTLAAARTFTLGTPGAITAVSTDSVSATSHTHSLSAANVGLRVGQLSVGTVGTFAFLHYPGNTVVRNPGFSQPGSGLRYANSGPQYITTVLPTGTWEVQGIVTASANTMENGTSVWLRVI